MGASLDEAIEKGFVEQRVREAMREETLAALRRMVEDHEASAQALRDAIARLER